jgi:transcriptional regulator with XRE-family HTH domain
MSVDDERPGQRLAALFRSARIAGHLTQDQVIVESGVSEASYKRYERGDIDSPNPAHVVAICRVLGINPREAAIAIGFGTRDDFGLPPEEPPYPAIVTEIGRILADPALSAPARAALQHGVTETLRAWRMAMAAHGAPTDER